MTLEGGKHAANGVADSTVNANEGLDEEARVWVGRLLSGEATQGDARALALWRALSPNHETAFIGAARLQGAIKQAVIELRAERSDKIQHRSRLLAPPSRRMVLGGAIAASSGGVALLIGERAGVGPWAESADFETVKGQTRTLNLAQGVSIELNTLTRIAMRPESGNQAFELLSGELIASLTSTINPPLAVFADNGRVIADRGRFALRKIAAGVDVSCLDGGIELLLRRRRVSLVAGQAVSYARDRIGAVISIDPDVIEGWRRGVLIFRNRPLGDVIAELNRYRPGRIVLANPGLSARRVSGTFYLASIDQVLEQMRLGYGARVSRLPGGVVVVS